MRAFKFLLVFIAVAGSIFALVIGTNYSAFKTLFENNDGMRDGYEYIESTYSLKSLTEFIGEHPEFMSVVSFNVNDPDSGIFYMPDTPRALGTLSNFFLILEYERQVNSGLLNPDEEVASWDDIERFSLPEVSEESHRKSYELLGIKDENPITLDKLVATMAETNDLAISDYIWFKLGEENIKALMDSLPLSTTGMPLPFSGLYLSIHSDIPEDDPVSLAEKLRTDNAFNQTTKELFEDNRLNLSFMEERDALALFPQTTAREIAQVMASLQKEELLSPGISQKVKEKMRWVFGGSSIQRSFSEYGALYDNRMGMLSGIDFGTSIYDGHTSAQAVFFDRLPVAFWLHLSSNHMQEDFQQRLIWDPALYETTLTEITEDN